MARQEIDVRATTPAGAQTVYALLIDGSTWPDWSPLGSFELAQPGADGGEGLGAVRVFRTGLVRSQEQIVELIPAERFSYILQNGLPLRDYRADVELSRVAEGTEIRWHSTFTAKLPGTGPLYRRQLERFIRRTVDGLSERAAHEEASPRSTPSGERR